MKKFCMTLAVIIALVNNQFCLAQEKEAAPKKPQQKTPVKAADPFPDAPKVLTSSTPKDEEAPILDTKTFKIPEIKKPEAGFQAKVEHLSMIYTKEVLVPVKVEAHGDFPDSCTKIDKTSQKSDGRTVYLTLTTLRQPDLICTQGITPFKEIIPLDLSGFKAGSYIVNVNGEEETFSLEEDVPTEKTK